MNSISSYIIAIFELIEAEGRELRSAIITIFTSIIFLVLFSLFILSSYALLMFGLYEYLILSFSSYVSAFILSGVTFIIALITLGFVTWRR